MFIKRLIVTSLLCCTIGLCHAQSNTSSDVRIKRIEIYGVSFGIADYNVESIYQLIDDVKKSKNSMRFSYSITDSLELDSAKKIYSFIHIRPITHHPQYRLAFKIIYSNGAVDILGLWNSCRNEMTWNEKECRINYRLINFLIKNLPQDRKNMIEDRLNGKYCKGYKRK